MKRQIRDPANPSPSLSLENIQHGTFKIYKSRKRRAQSIYRIVLHLFSIPFFQKNRMVSGAGTFCSGGICNGAGISPAPAQGRAARQWHHCHSWTPWLGKRRISFSSSSTLWAEVWLLISYITLRIMDREIALVKLLVSAATADFGGWS